MNRNKRKIESISENDGENTLLQLLRRDGKKYCWTEESNGEAMPLLIRHQSEFPSRVQAAIRNAVNNKEADPKAFCRLAHNAWCHILLAAPIPVVPWRALDSAIDTKEQVEVAVRFFPEILNIATSCRVVFWHSIHARSLPFAPLIVELGTELDVLTEELKGYLVRSIFEFTSKANDEYNRKLDEVTLSVVKRLTENGFLRKGGTEVFKLCAKAMELRPSRIQKTLKFLLEWDPAVLKGDFSKRTYPILWKCFSIYEMVDKETTFQRFQMLVELGMVHYPEEMGFAFHKVVKFGSVTMFEYMSRRFGSKRVTEMIEKVIIRKTRGNSKSIQTLLVSIAERNNMDEDAYYLLCRLHPAAFKFVPLVPRD